MAFLHVLNNILFTQRWGFNWSALSSFGWDTEKMDQRKSLQDSEMYGIFTNHDP